MCNPDYNICVDIPIMENEQAYINKLFGLDLNPIFNYENIIPLNDGNKTFTIVFHDKSIFKKKDYLPIYILSLVPGLDNLIRKRSCASLKGLSYQGLPGEWIKEYDTQNKIIDHVHHNKIPHTITVPYESFEKYSSKKIFVKHQIPECLHEMIARESFKMINCHMLPFHPFNVSEFSKNISNSSTKYELIKKIRSKYNDQIQIVEPIMNDWLYQTCVVYMNQINESKHIVDTTGYIMDYGKTLNDFYQMTIMLYEMGMPCLDESEIRLRYTTDDDPCETHSNAFEKFKQIGIFTLTDDLITSSKLIKLLNIDGILLKTSI